MLIGFSEITILHTTLLRACGLVGIHGAAWDAESFGSRAAESFVKSVITVEPIVIHSTADEYTSKLTTSGKVLGRLIGGNQDSIATAVGWALPDFEGAILLIEAFNLRLSHIDRQLTMLRNTDVLKNIIGIAIDVLRDRFKDLGVPILGGLPIGHGKNPIGVPVSTIATLDADNRVLTVESGVS